MAKTTKAKPTVKITVAVDGIATVYTISLEDFEAIGFVEKIRGGR